MTSLSRSSFARISLAAGLVFVVLIAGTEAGRVTTVLRGAGALVGATAILFYLLRAPREHDFVDQLVLLGLLLFLATCVTAAMPRATFDAATTATAYVAAFYLARGAVATESGRRFAISVLGILGIVVGVGFAVVWATTWFRWISVPGAGLPPLDMPLPGSPYRHPYAVAMFAAMLLPASLSLVPRPWIGPIALFGSVAILLVGIMSGARTVWLAGFVGLIAALAVSRRRLPLPKLNALTLILGTAATAVIVALSAMAMSRLSNTLTIELRLAIWSDSLERWLASPLVGFGPGGFAPQLTLSGYYGIDQIPVPHGHNALIQMLVEGGLVGLAALMVICAGVILGIVQAQRRDAAATGALAFFAVAALTDNPSVDASAVLALIVWAAIACPRNVQRSREPHPGIRAALLAAGALVVVAGSLAFAASFAFDRASSAARLGDGDAAVRELAAATQLDPALALYRRQLGIWLMAQGDRSESVEQLQQALAANPADTTTQRALALALLQAGSPADALRVSERAWRLAPSRVENALTMAYVAKAAGDGRKMDLSLADAVSRAPELMAAAEWRELFPDTDVDAVLRAAQALWSTRDDPLDRNLGARVWLAAIAGDAVGPGVGEGLRSEAAILQCNREEASAVLDGREGSLAGDSALRARLLLARAFDTSIPPGLLTLLSIREPGLENLATEVVRGDAPTWDYTHDVQVYGRLPIPPPTGPILPTVSSGLSVWLRTPLEAADAGAPSSGLARCR